MSSPRVQKILRALSAQLRLLGPYSGKFTRFIRAEGRDANGRDAILLDFTDASWSTGNFRAIVAANPASDVTDTDALKTQSHASGHFLDGGVDFDVYMETPSSFTNSHAQFHREMMHALRGQLGAPVNLKLTANAVEPTLDGLDGASATATTTDAGTYQPYFFALPGGV